MEKAAVTVGSSSEYGMVAIVSPELFRVFGVEPVLGRAFTPEEQKKGGAAAVLVSHSYWQGHLGGNVGALGTKLRMLDKTFSIVGVLPAGFHFPKKTDIWFPSSTFEE